MTIQETKSARLVSLDTATGPGIDGLTITDSLGNGGRIFQNSASQFTLQGQGSTTLFVVVPSLAMQAAIQSFADGNYDIGTASSRFRDLYPKRVLNRDHAAFTGSEHVTTTGAVQTTNATTTTVWTSPTILDNSGTWIEVHVSARDTGGTDRGLAVRRALVTRQAAGAATLVGAVTDVQTNMPAAWGGGVALTQCTLDTTGNTIRVRVQGAAGVTINWAATIRYQSVSGNT